MTPPSGGDHQSDLTLPQPQADFIWRCAWLSVPSASYAATTTAATTHLVAVFIYIFTSIAFRPSSR